MTEKFDPNRIVKFERAIAEKYGEETIQNPKANWDLKLESVYQKQRKDRILKENEKLPDEMIEINGVFIPAKLVRKETNRSCPLCSLYSFNPRDDYYFAKFEVCEKCFIQHIEDREEKWEQKKKVLLKKKENS